MQFDADRPIETGEDDLLGRKPFAMSIARQILTIPAQHGFTVAVAGPWGSGKTSVLNMVEETLKDGDNGVVPLKFNPWLFSGPEELVSRFFRELGSQVGMRDLSGLKEIGKALFELGDALAPLSPIPGTNVMIRWVARLIRRSAKPKSLLDQRASLMGALSKSESKIVVVIDDIDRLEHNETRELMRLIRLMSDMPNVIFLLAYDGDRVAKSLDEDSEEGRNYLDKIVQQSYDLPAVRQGLLHLELRRALNDILQGREVTPLDSREWQRIFYEIVAPLIRNLRDVKRYVNSLPVTLDSVGHEVALADLMGLEALRVLRPKT